MKTKEKMETKLVSITLRKWGWYFSPLLNFQEFIFENFYSKIQGLLMNNAVFSHYKSIIILNNKCVSNGEGIKMKMREGRCVCLEKGMGQNACISLSSCAPWYTKHFLLTFLERRKLFRNPDAFLKNRQRITKWSIRVWFVWKNCTLY